VSRWQARLGEGHDHLTGLPVVRVSLYIPALLLSQSYPRGDGRLRLRLWFWPAPERAGRQFIRVARIRRGPVIDHLRLWPNRSKTRWLYSREHAAGPNDRFHEDIGFKADRRYFENYGAIYGGPEPAAGDRSDFVRQGSV